MKRSIIGRLIMIGALVLLSLAFLLPNMSMYESMPGWWKSVMPERGITMGLDLQGGLHLVFEVEGERAVEIETERLAAYLKDEAAKKGLKVTTKTAGDTVSVEGANAEFDKLVSEKAPILDRVSTGTYRYSASEARNTRSMAVDQALEKIRNRIDQFGVSEPTIIRQGENEILVQLPGVKDPKRAIDIIGKTAQLEFKIVDDKSSVAAEIPSAIKPDQEQALLEQFAEKLPAGTEIRFIRRKDENTGEQIRLPILLQKEAAVTGDLLSDARVSIDQRFNEYYVSLTFNETGAKIFEKVTGAHIGDRMAIVLDGVVHSAPVIQDKIGGGSAQITGNFSMNEAKDLAVVLKIGALPAPVKMLQNVTVGPSLGRDSIEAGKRAGLIGSILVMVFMIVYYRLSGFIADIALALNILLLLGAMAMLNATMTMPGIAGVILAVGMAVDSNVLMFERMREELRAGKTPRAAVDSGYHKAFWTIFDSHVTTLITSLVLFQFGTGPIKGFAVTLSIGVAINLFTALVGTKTIFDMVNNRKEVRSLSI